MKTKLLHVVLFILIFTIACKKSIDSLPPETVPDIQTTENTGIPYPQHPSLNCQYAPKYGDSIVYPQPPAPNDYIIFPTNNKGLAGDYYSWPAGLLLDSKTGSINLTRSETGQRYNIAFVLNGGTDTCISSLIIAGASYIDSVYVLSVSDKSAPPYFNANPFAIQPCQGPGCFFDWNNFASNQGIIIDKNTGYINLKSTMKNNPFGLSPINGATIFTTVYYALNDNSNYAHQKIDLELIYFDSKADIPKDILTTISTNRINTMSNTLLSKGPKTRPPLVVIVRQN